MGRRVFLGVDTSCYTTSLAVVDQSGTLLQELRKPLPVAAGEVGLRQSDGVFHHVRNLPQLIQSLEIGVCEVQAVGVSDRPRPVSGSYMPVFLAGVAVAQALATSSAAPLYRFPTRKAISLPASGDGRCSIPFSFYISLAAHLSCCGCSRRRQVLP